MALPHGSSESEDDEYHSLSGQEPGPADDEDGDSMMEPPQHPLPSMQGAFEESIFESTQDDETVLPPTNPDAEVRRQKLLEAQQYDDTWETRWRQRKGARYHPLLKLMAQIVFGMHLLQQGQAKSNDEVVRILQAHVNEADTFLERTSEDFNLAIADIDERIRHLKLPMQHLDIFNSMLDDKEFRTQLLEGNDRIEKIIDRTAKAMNAALMDVRKGFQATQELGKYLNTVQGRWPTESSGIADVYDAMRGNEQGWIQYLKDLQAKGNKLGNHLFQLGTVIGEISKLAATASRRNTAQGRPVSPSRSARSAPVSPGLRSKFAREDQAPMPTIALALNKPLPKEPDAASSAAQMAIPKPHPVPFAQRYEQPRQSPAPSGRRVSSMPNSSPARPKTAGAPRDARQSAAATSELADFLRQSGPSSSNPPPIDESSSEPDGVTQKTRGRSQSQGGNAVPLEHAAEIARSKSHGAAVILTSSRQKEKPTRSTSKSAGNLSDAETSHSGRQDSVASTGFARRISTRMKHLRPPQHSTSTRKAPMPTIESAYSSGTDNKTSSESPMPPQEPARPPSRLGLFPKLSEPLTPTAASMRNDTNDWDRVTRLPAGTQKAPLPDPNRKSRALSIRRMFHRREKSQMVT